MSDEFAGIQTHDAPNPDAKPYRDPMQWWYDLSPAQQDQFREEQVKFIQNVCDVVGVASVSTNANWESPWNPRGLNPAVWTIYKAKTKS